MRVCKHLVSRPLRAFSSLSYWVLSDINLMATRCPVRLSDMNSVAKYTTEVSVLCSGRRSNLYRPQNNHSFFAALQICLSVQSLTRSDTEVLFCIHAEKRTLVKVAQLTLHSLGDLDLISPSRVSARVDECSEELFFAVLDGPRQRGAIALLHTSCDTHHVAQIRNASKCQLQR